MKNIVNVINFVRAVEPRPGRNIDLKEPVREQIRLLKETGLRGTFLLQYDALLDNEFVDMMKDCADFAEVGIWYEIVQPLVEKIGEKWNGRYSWDWYNDVGFLIGYEPSVRLKLIDESMAKFKEIFGKYPDSVGSWHIDAVSMKYLSEKYNVSACCICRDQIGCDGYTMQGGYFNQAYYPGKYNMFCPANSKETQINMPVFRMLGSCPIYELDFQLYDNVAKRGVPTLEPVSENYGGNEQWCDWFFKENFNGAGMSMQYTQVGQENSFGWKRMKKGLEYQMQLVKKLSDEGKIEVQTLGESGKWFKSSFDVTPVATQAALSDFWDNNKSVWYNSRFYRVNLYFENGYVKIRDMYVFGDKLKERYLEKRCETKACEYRTLPVMDAALYSNPSGKVKHAGVFITENGKDILWDTMEYSESEKENKAVVTLCAKDKKLEIILSEKSVSFVSDISDLKLVPKYDKDYVYGLNTDRDTTFGNHNNRSVAMTYLTDAHLEDNKLKLAFSGINYGVIAEKGVFNEDYSVDSVDGKINVSVFSM